MKAVIYLEEEIRSGGAGMLLSDRLADFDKVRNVPYAVMATDNDFVYQKKGKTMYESAGVSKSDIVAKIKDLIK